jgi:methyl acetate hydrolase
MRYITRRTFAGIAAAFTGAQVPLHGQNETSLTKTLGESIKRNRIPAAAVMVATADRVVYQHAFGTRDGSSHVPITSRSIFRIASMTKPVTAVSAMQLVERGKLQLDDPASKYLPELEKVQVLDGFSGDGQPNLRPPASPILVRHLLTHTSGFAYDLWNADQRRYSQWVEKTKAPASRVAPLSFDPGTRWAYGTSMDWTGRLVEAVSGKTLEAWFQTDILQPLGMRDTSFIMAPQKYPRLVSYYKRDQEGNLKEEPRKMPKPAKSFNGGGGLYSTAEDYVKFMQMFLHHGSAPGGRKVLRPETVDLMCKNQIGELSAGKLKTEDAASSSDMDMHPGHTDGFGYGFLINAEDYEGGRAAGSLAWAGIDNTFFWIDPTRRVCATIMMQFLPFCDSAAVAVLRDFEKGVYGSLKPAGRAS